MAYYAALVSLVQLLEDIIHRDQYPNLLLDKQQIASVYEKLSLLQTLLDDYSPKDREAADSLERRIRDAAYQAQDLIEFHISNQMHLYLSKRNQMPQQLQELEEVKEEVDSIVEELMRIKLESHTIKDNLLLNYSAAAATSNQASGTNSTGFKERLETIMGELCGERSKLQVVSIVGMGGIGKTTIARNIFDDKFMECHFDCRFWVTISQDYDLENVLLDILDCMNVTIDKSSKVAELGTTMYKHLQGRKYLIVMDDMWDTKVWDYMKSILPDNSNGSRIMITTRISNVALYVDRFGFHYQMELLSEEESWNLFRQKVCCPPELEDIGWLIAKNCGGLPLAIVVVAGLLSTFNKKRSDWEEIVENISSEAVENNEDFSKVLSLSYNHLPHHLKPLFLYIGCFPKDYKIRVSTLVKLWIAEGFLNPVKSKSLEAMVEECLQDLVNRNLLLITKRKSNGKIKYCGIHDVLRDLCMKVINHEDFLHVLHQDYYFRPTATSNVRRLSVRGHLCPPSQFIGGEAFGSHVRSIICHTFGWKFSFFKSSFKLLRVLDATNGGDASRFPANILEFFHLKYLAFTTSFIPNIPPSISILQNLQTLIIESHSWRSKFCSLPSQIRQMPNLRHVICRNGLHFVCVFFNERIVGESPILENLQTLSSVYNVRFTSEVVRIIPNLQKLKVSCDGEEDVEWQMFCLDNLFHLSQLETLSISFLSTREYKVNPLPEKFALPIALKKLTLTECRLPWKDMTVVGSLPNLQVLKLKDDAFVGEKWEPLEGEFPHLKFLLMEELELVDWQAEKTHFPTLKHLKISSCNKLEEIPLEIGEISTLELIEVHYSKVAAKSAVKIQEEQREEGNDVLQVRVYPQYRYEEESDRDEEQQEEALKSEDEIQKKTV